MIFAENVWDSMLGPGPPINTLFHFLGQISTWIYKFSTYLDVTIYPKQL